MPVETARCGGNLVICNLQQTPLTSMAKFQIFAKTDVVMSMLMERLSTAIPPFQLVRRVIVGATSNEVYAKAVDVHDETIQMDCICAVDWDGKGLPRQAVRDPIAAAQVGAHRHTVAGLGIRTLHPCLHFVGHYHEPPLQLDADLSRLAGSSSAKILDFLLTFDPYARSWTATCKEFQPTPATDDDARITDYGRSHREYCIQKVMQARGTGREDSELVIKNRVIESMQACGRSRHTAEQVVEGRIQEARAEVQRRKEEQAIRRISLLRKIQKEKRRLQAEDNQLEP